MANFLKDKVYPSIVMIALFLLSGIVLSEASTKSSKISTYSNEKHQDIDSKEYIHTESISSWEETKNFKLRR